MVDILERQVELIFVVLGVAAIFRAAISQHAAEPHLPRIIERTIKSRGVSVVSILYSSLAVNPSLTLLPHPRPNDISWDEWQ
jgi:hypothetical protein